MTSAGAPQTKKVFCRGKPREWVPTRKTATGAGWNKYLDLCTTHTPLLQSFLSPRAPIKKGPTPFKHPRGESRIAKNFQILYCEFIEAVEAT